MHITAYFDLRKYYIYVNAYFVQISLWFLKNNFKSLVEL